MKTGDVVLVRFFGDSVGARVVIQVEENNVIICNREEWNNAMNEKRTAEGIRVRIDDLVDRGSISTDINSFAQV